MATLDIREPDQAHLNERYVREWLAAMVVGRIIDYNPEHKSATLH